MPCPHCRDFDQPEGERLAGDPGCEVCDGAGSVFYDDHLPPGPLQTWVGSDLLEPR